jgi:hypothetical protein
VIGLFKECAKPLLGSVVIAFTEFAMTNVARCVDKVVGRLVLVVEVAPNAVVVVHGNWISDAEFLHCFANICLVFLEEEFRRMNTNDDQATIFVFGIPCLNAGQRAKTIDAGKSPEVD